MALHISQFYSCSEVSLACELYYICELGKYAKYNYNQPVSIDGVILHSVLKKSPIWHYFRMAVEEGWIINSGVNEDDFPITIQNPLDLDKQVICNYLFVLDEVPFDKEDSDARRNSLDYDLRTPIRSKISFEAMEDSYWLWSINGFENSNFLSNNKSLNHSRADQAWLSLIAMVAVERLQTGHPTNLLLDICGQVVLNNMAISYIMILTEKTQCLQGWCHFKLDETISNQTTLQLGYTAWYAEGRDIGLLDRWYNGAEKYKYLQELDIKTGDLVVLYEREKSQRQNFVKAISSCHIAKVTYLTESSMGFELINTVKPYFQGKEDFDNHTVAVKKMYMGNPPYAELKTSSRSIDLADLGVEYLMYNEKFFIVPLDGADDCKVVRVSDGVRKDTLLLNQNDLIYWILKDYKYDFNEDRFLARHFKEQEPAYTRYMRGETLEDDYYYKPEQEV